MVLRSVHTCVSLHCMCQHLHITLFSLILSFHLSLIPLNRFHLGDVNFCLEQIQMPIRHTTVNPNSERSIDEPRAFYTSSPFRCTNAVIENKRNIRWTKVEDKFQSLYLRNFLTIKKKKKRRKKKRIQFGQRRWKERKRSWTIRESENVRIDRKMTRAKSYLLESP